MVDRTTKLRWRRRVRRSRKQVENISVQAEQRLEQHVIGRLSRLWRVRRFLLSWVLLTTLLASILVVQARSLSNFYQSPTPIPGGTYTEGIPGEFTTANPLYAKGPVDSAVARLVFSGLFKYNDQNQLIGDLAKSWEVNERGNIYTVHLRPNLRWQDGVSLTSADVVYTYKTIQNPDAQSPLFNSWQGVEVTATDANTVTFRLPQALSSFPYNMTNGLVPKHILERFAVNQLRTIDFNTTEPVGSGPFAWKTIQVVAERDGNEDRVALTPNQFYVDGEPKLANFVIRAFHNEKAVAESFNRQELDGVAGFNTLPAEISKKSPVREYSFPLTAQTMVFLKTSSGLLADVNIRQALNLATDSQDIAANIGYPVQVVDEPMLRSAKEYDKSLAQAVYNPVEANLKLDSLGWYRASDGIRRKDGQQLTFTVFSEDTPEYSYVASKLKSQWRAVGVNAKFVLQPPSELQTTLAFHSYDALLYGISVGIDPDVFAYWHSSQADVRSTNRLNFSEYKSPAADKALEAGRSRSDSALRSIKYRPFLEAWRNDTPAIGLYQPRVLYFTRHSVAGLNEHTINTPLDRFSNVQNWMIREAMRDNP